MKILKAIVLAAVILSLFNCGNDDDENAAKPLNNPDITGTYIGDYVYDPVGADEETFEDVKLIVSEKDGAKYKLSTEDQTSSIRVEVLAAYQAPYEIIEIKNSGTGYFNGGIAAAKYWGDSLFFTALHLEPGTNNILGAGKITAVKQ